jgi:FtsP/CotA-like multicopper oxidase with cupredoxin domain
MRLLWSFRRADARWGYNDVVPGPELRITEGDTLRVKVNNRLPAETMVHWHGLPIVNDMDGVPNVTQPPIASGEEFVYEFAVPVSGSYMCHSHVGLQLDRGLHGPLIVESKSEDLDYDREYTLMLDDWLDGTPGAPEDALEDLRNSGGGMGGGMMGGRGSNASGDVDYPLYLVNGRSADDPRNPRSPTRTARSPTTHEPGGGYGIPFRGGRTQANRNAYRRTASRAG